MKSALLKARLQQKRGGDVAFFDIEASGLNGVPIEVGWALPDLATGKIVQRSALIRPPAAWRIADLWDGVAEAVHGITMDVLMADGQTPDVICAALNHELAGYVLYADAPEWDLPWLDALFAASSHDRSFDVSSQDALRFIGHEARAHGWSAQSFADVITQVDATYPHIHRAGPDAARLAALWLAANNQSTGWPSR